MGAGAPPTVVLYEAASTLEPPCVSEVRILAMIAASPFLATRAAAVMLVALAGATGVAACKPGAPRGNRRRHGSGRECEIPMEAFAADLANRDDGGRNDASAPSEETPGRGASGDAGVSPPESMGRPLTAVLAEPLPSQRETSGVTLEAISSLPGPAAILQGARGVG